MARPIELHPEAVLEAEGAYRWYRDRNDAAAEAFLAELDRAVALISESPIVGRFTFTVVDIFCYVDFLLLSSIVTLVKPCRSWRSRTGGENPAIGRVVEVISI